MCHFAIIDDLWQMAQILFEQIISPILSIGIWFLAYGTNYITFCCGPQEVGHMANK
jgi:hypothetical protein